MKAIYLGPEWSFSQLALPRILRILGIQNVEEEMKKRNEDIPPALLKERSALALVAMHTAAKGKIDKVIEQFIPMLDDRSAMLRGEVAMVMPIHFALLCREEAEREDLQGIIAHEKAFDPCRGVISQFKRRREADSNSAAAKKIATNSRYANWAALAPVECASGYGLKILGEDVSDGPAMTTFYAFSKGVEIPRIPSKKWRLLAFFKIDHKPGSLHRITGVMRRHNMSYLDSVSVSGDECRFVLEADVSNEAEGIELIAKLRSVTQTLLATVFPIVLCGD